MVNILTLIFCVHTLFSFSQEVSYSIGLQKTPTELRDYLKSDSSIDLIHVRFVSDILTNPAIPTFNGMRLPKRKKIVVRKVKELNEQIELAYLQNRKLDSTLRELLFELEWIHLSYLQKAKNDEYLNISFQEKRRMFFSTLKSKRALTIKLPKTKKELNYPLVNSPFFKELNDTIRPEERFDQLAKKTSINASKIKSVVLDSCARNGSIPKFDVHDLQQENNWIVKWGDEIHTEIFSSHLFSALGYNVDFSYYYQDLMLLFDDYSEVKTTRALIDSIKVYYNIDVSNYVRKTGEISEEMAQEDSSLVAYIGRNYVLLKECLLEARPDRIKRIGSFVPGSLENFSRIELRASLLAHQLIANWDTREENTLLSLVKMGSDSVESSAVFSDLGTSMGVHISWFNQDFKAGLVNELDWVALKKVGNKLKFTSRMNAQVELYQQADYYDLKWLAMKLEKIDSLALKSMIDAAHWPPPIATLYFHKMASRRASILNAFEIYDSNPIHFDKKLSVKVNGLYCIKKGKLCKTDELESQPISYINKKGRLRNYGN